MKTKILFFVVLLALAPTFSTVSYGQAALQRLAGGLLRKAVEKRNNTKTLDVATSRTNGNSVTNTNEVTLVVSGDGETKDKAINIALRSAIEQAYGTFVSANTTIVNDELTRDEIVTISNGNIKGYKELSSMQVGGKTAVTLEATVSISNLITYAQSKRLKAGILLRSSSLLNFSDNPFNVSKNVLLKVCAFSFGINETTISNS